MENGEEKYIQMNEEEMIADVDKIRKENGWKPIKRGSEVGSNSGGAMALPMGIPQSTAAVTVTPTTSKSKKKGDAAKALQAQQQAQAQAALAATLTPEQKVLLRLKEEMQSLGAQGMSAADQMRIQKEALK